MRSSNVLSNVRLSDRRLKIYSAETCRPLARLAGAAGHERYVHTATDLEEAREAAYQAGHAQGLSEGDTQGFARGREEGYARGCEQEQTRLRSESEALEVIVSEVLEERTRVLTSAGKALADLTLEIARRVIRRAISWDEEVVMRIVTELLEYVEGAQQVVLRVNPQDAELVQDRMAEVRSALGQEAHLELRPDPSIGVGGCILDTPDLRYDATLEGMLARFEEALTAWSDNQLLEPGGASTAAPPVDVAREEGRDDAA